ncbi:hypothetical protein NXS19_010648 [Fusarium pseudograminearum]|nr:hypothetical protein NXS19_010648 [Fusarium pseudograminearum]
MSKYSTSKPTNSETVALLDDKPGEATNMHDRPAKRPRQMRLPRVNMERLGELCGLIDAYEEILRLRVEQQNFGALFCGTWSRYTI